MIIKWQLFLDDERDPDDPVEYVICRNSSEAIKFILLNGLPTYMSLDHDLGGHDTGMVFVKGLVEYCLDRRIMFTTEWNIHSQNVEGAKNMKSMLEQLTWYTKDF